MQGVRITAIISAYNEEDIIRQTVADLVQQDIAAHVIDDGSTDGTVAALASLESGGLVRVETLSPGAVVGAAREFSLSRVLARKEQLARELEAEWFLNHDADEFRESPWGHLNLRQGIELVDRLGYNAVDFAVLNFWPTHDGFDGHSDVREVFRHYEDGAAFDRMQVRCWKKAADIELVSTGGHDARFEGRRVFPLRFLLRHYPIRGQAHGTRKVFDERRARFSDEERQRGWHVQYNAFQPGQAFVRDPGSLRLYDPDEIRAQLQIEHRGVEALTSELAAATQAVREQQEAAACAQAAHGAEIARLLAEVASQQQQLADVSKARSDLAGAYRAVEQQFQGLEESYRTLETNARHLEHQLADMKQSWSWKLTALLRTAWRRQNP